MKTIAFAASNSQHSINKALVSYAAQVLMDEVIETEVEILSVQDFDAPMYSIDTENESGIPEAARALYERFAAVDQIIISYAEHNGSYVAAYKSLFDWMSRIDRNVFHNKPTVALATSPGQGGGSSVLSQAVASASFFGADVKASLSVPMFNEAYDSKTAAFSDANMKAKLVEALNALRA
jgi:NAD(P)H-dependent FMN reductase